jgi:hypothetical protein
MDVRVEKDRPPRDFKFAIWPALPVSFLRVSSREIPVLDSFICRVVKADDRAAHDLTLEHHLDNVWERLERIHGQNRLDHALYNVPISGKRTWEVCKVDTYPCDTFCFDNSWISSLAHTPVQRGIILQVKRFLW